MKRRTFLATSVGLYCRGNGSSTLRGGAPVVALASLGCLDIDRRRFNYRNRCCSLVRPTNANHRHLDVLDSGWMSAQISGAKPGTISRADFMKLSPVDRHTWFKEYYAYYAKFEVDEEARVIAHRIVDSLFPYEKGIVYKRSFELNEDILTLSTEPREEGGRTTFNRLAWKKAA